MTRENCEDLERFQKCAVKVILGKEYEKFETYEDALSKANLDALENRREELCKKFATKCLKNEKARNIFPTSFKTHKMSTRDEEPYEVKFAHTGRLQKSAVPFMQRLLNKDERVQTQNKKRKIENEEYFQSRKRKPG